MTGNVHIWRISTSPGGVLFKPILLDNKNENSTGKEKKKRLSFVGTCCFWWGDDKEGSSAELWRFLFIHPASR